MVEKRSTLTLGQKVGSKNKELGMSSDIKNQLLLRQQKLKVSQKDKIIENRQKQEEEKKKFEAEKRAEERDINFSKTEWDRRVKTDNVDFSQDKVAHICNFRVDNYNKTIYNLIKEIKEDIRLWKNG